MFVTFLISSKQKEQKHLIIETLKIQFQTL